MKKTIRITLLLGAVLALGAILAGCGESGKEEEEGKTSFQIGCMPLNEPAVQAISDMLKDDKPYLLVVEVEQKGMVYPMVPAGTCVTNIIM